MYGTEYAIASICLVHHDAESVDVHDLVECLALAAHLLVDAVQVLFAAQYVAFQAFALEAVDQRLFDLLDDLVAITTGAPHGGADALGAHRVHGLEAEILELHAHGVHTQPVGDGRVDLEGFLGDAAALFAGEHFQRAHVVQAVGELDQDHANIASHGHGHLLEVLGLCFGLGLEVHLGQLADPIDQFGNGFAELRDQCVLGNAGVFDDVMQHRGHQALMVHVHVGKDIGYREGVGDVGFTAAPSLPVVGLLGVEIGTADQVDLVWAEVGR